MVKAMAVPMSCRVLFNGVNPLSKRNVRLEWFVGDHVPLPVDVDDDNDGDDDGDGGRNGVNGSGDDGRNGVNGGGDDGRGGGDGRNRGSGNGGDGKSGDDDDDDGHDGDNDDDGHDGDDDDDGGLLGNVFFSFREPTERVQSLLMWQAQMTNKCFGTVKEFTNEMAHFKPHPHGYDNENGHDNENGYDNKNTNTHTTTTPPRRPRSHRFLSHFQKFAGNINEMTFLVLGTQPTSLADVHRACQRIQKFAWVGSVSHFNASVCLFHHVFGGVSPMIVYENTRPSVSVCGSVARNWSFEKEVMGMEREGKRKRVMGLERDGEKRIKIGKEGRNGRKNRNMQKEKEEVGRRAEVGKRTEVWYDQILYECAQQRFLKDLATSPCAHLKDIQRS